MRKQNRGERESSLQGGWTVEGPLDPAPVLATSAASATEKTGAEDGSQDIDSLSGVEGSAVELADATAPAQMSNLTVVMLGLTGGLYMLYAWIWLSWAQYYSGVNALTASGSGAIGGVLQQIVFWIAPLAPVLWFLAAFLMLRGKQRALAVALVLGLVVLLPLPMLFTRGAAL